MIDNNPLVNYSPLLLCFIEKFKFNLLNLNELNINGVTPLTAAIDNNQEEIVIELLYMNVNPLIENIHGNTPLKLSLNKPWCYNIIEQAINLQVCEVLNCKLGNTICLNKINYKIIKIINTGSCSLVSMEIQEMHTLKIYFAKIKTSFGGLEIRNYISLNQYIDLLKISKLIISDPNKDTFMTYHKVYCLIQKHIVGKVLSEILTNLDNDFEKKIIIKATIKALCELHNQGYVHNDALPDNCIWDPILKVANFIDFDVMSKVTDFDAKDQEFFVAKQLLDFERLIIGHPSIIPNKNILGLKDYVEDLSDILFPNEECEVNSIPSSFRKKLLSSNKLKI